MPRNPVYTCVFCPPANFGAWVLRFHSLFTNPPAVTAGFFRLIPSLLFILLLPSSFIMVHAQSSTATLSGTVTDQADAVVPGVNIAVISVAQVFQRTTTTNGEGVFVVPALPPGNYIVKAEREGFNTSERRVVLNVNDEAVIKIQLKVGDVSQTIEIVDSNLIDQSPSVSTLIDQQFVDNLPLNGRSFQALITLTPGTVLTKAGGSGLETGQFSVNGQRANANYFTVDGVSANVAMNPGFAPGQSSAGSLPALSASGGTNSLVSVDALQEFKVQTSTYAAEFGRTPGAQVQIVTRSGTNAFRGTLFEYFRNDALDANDFFANRRGLKKPALRQNDFGGVLGGPILLPRFGEGGRQPWYDGRNRTFFFFSYEGLRLRLPQTAFTDVPSLSARQTAPANVQPFLSAFPRPTGPTQPNGFAEFAATYSDPSNLNATSIRIDHSQNNQLTLFGRYNYAPSDTAQRGASGQSLNTSTVLSTTTQTLTFGATFAATTRVVNELRANYSRVTGTGFFRLDSFGGAYVPPDSVFFPSFASSQTDYLDYRILLGRNSAIAKGILADNLQRQLNLVDNLSSIRGAHQLKFGIDYRHLSPVIGIRNYAQFNFIFGMAQAVAGKSLQSLVFNQSGPQVPIFHNLSFYAQDTWKLIPRLTFTYGLRYEINPPPSEAHNNDPFTVTGIDNPATITLAPRGTPLYKTTYNNFAPRIGVAYQLSQTSGRETILRGGFGAYYDLGSGQAAAAFGNAFPFAATKPVIVPGGAPFPLPPDLAAPPSISLTPPVSNLVYAFGPNFKLPYTLQWNAAVEQSLGGNQVLTISYVGAAGRRLVRQDQLQNPNPNFSTSVIILNNAATSDYRALQLQFQRRLSRGLQALASYTWARSLDIASNDSGANVPGVRLDPKLDRGYSDFDVRHAFNGAITYNIPTPSAGTFGRAILRNFALDAIFSSRSATPVNVTYGANFGFGFFRSNFRPDLVEGAALYVNDRVAPGGRRINPAAFVIPKTPRQGTLERNGLRGFPVHQVDLALRRQFNFTERLNIQLKAEFFNILNHPNFGDPDGNLGDTNAAGTLFPNAFFGQSSVMLGRSLGSGGIAGGFNPLYQIGGPRSIQLSFKLNF